MRYILVSGGVISGVGKGIIASSTGLLLKTLGLRVSCIKIDPYVSVDAGLMSPGEHGECFVLSTGHEVDLDLGNYERYLSVCLSGDNNITTGKIYQHVIEKERKGAYLGRTVQIVPHIVDEIKDWIQRVANTCVDGSGEAPDVCIIELGGTVGDIESMPFLEALTQLRHEVGSKAWVNIMVSYVPTVHGEQKTKPTQHAVKAIRSYGLIPDLVACRCEQSLAKSTVNKVALHCQVDPEQIVVVRDMPTIYQVPLLLREQGMLQPLVTQLRLDDMAISRQRQYRGSALWDQWRKTATSVHTQEVRIALVGKYTSTPDAYMSLCKSLEHASMKVGRILQLDWVDSELLEPKTKEEKADKYEQAWKTVKRAQGIIVPGGFGTRGVEGMMLAAKHAREHKIPFFGVCLGFQTAVIQFARDKCGLPGANSEEFHEFAEDKVIMYMPDVDRTKMGGTMRLGLKKTIFQQGTEWSKVRKLYGGGKMIEERHRHRYEVNPEYVERLSEAGINFIGKDETEKRMSVFELRDHPYYIGTQFHAEYQSRVLEPSKPYLGFVAAAAGRLDEAIKEVQSSDVEQLTNGTNGTHVF